MSVTYEDLYGDPPSSPTPAKGPTAEPVPAPVMRPAIVRPAGQSLRRFVTCSLPTMTNLNDVKVWLYLHTRADTDGTVKLSHAAIARRLGVARRTSIRSVKRLRAAGLLTVKRRGGYPNRVTVYRVVSGKPARRSRAVVPTNAGDT